MLPAIVSLVVAHPVLRLYPNLVFKKAKLRELSDERDSLGHLEALEARGRGEVVPEVHEVQRRHGLQDEHLKVG